MKPKVVSGTVLVLFLASMLSIWMLPVVAQPSEIVSYWRLNEGSGTVAYDSVGENNGTLNNGPQWTTGIVNGALYFDGVDDFVEVPDSVSLDVTTKISIEAWVNISKPGGPFHPQHYVVDSRDGMGGGYGLNVNTELIQFWIGDWWPDIPFSIQVDRWYHVVGTYDSSEIIVYVDGVEIGSAPFTGNINPSSSSLFIGQRYTYEERFNGIIDEVAIYNRALTQGEIQQHYQNGLLGLGYYSELTVISSPLIGIPFSINGTPQTTLYTGWLLEGYYTLVMPQTRGGYIFSHWLEDGDPNRTKTILLQGTTWTAVYERAPPPPEPVGGKAAPIVIPPNKIDLLAPYIGLSILLAVVAATVVYVKKRKNC